MIDVEQLYKKFLDRKCTREEAEALLDHFRKQDDSDHIMDMIQSELDRDEPLSDDPADLEAIAYNKLKIDERIEADKLTKRNTAWNKWIPYAAAILLFSAIGIIWLTYHSGNRQEQKLVSKYGDDVEAGKNRATITLDDGRVITLSEEQDGVSFDGQGVRYDDGTAIMDEVPISIATISTPNGGQYRISLSDGTKVMLNASSSLTYPSRFSEGKRMVELNGEAYFDVAHMQDVPFIVKSDGQHIEVLGTKFNVSAYRQEPVATTLVQGKVKVTSAKSQNVILDPGQQALMNRKNGDFSLKKVDVNEYIAWTNGEFVFNDAPIEVVFKNLERWYDVEFEYPSQVKNERIYAEISRNRNISDVLNKLEQVVNVKFQISERRVMVHR